MLHETPLRNAIAFGSERTMEQDPTFAFRIVVDIALKALSPAINDPTTAVLAIDQLTACCGRSADAICAPMKSWMLRDGCA